MQSLVHLSFFVYGCLVGFLGSKVGPQAANVMPMSSHMASYCILKAIL